MIHNSILLTHDEYIWLSVDYHNICRQPDTFSLHIIEGRFYLWFHTTSHWTCAAKAIAYVAGFEGKTSLAVKLMEVCSG